MPHSKDNEIKTRCFIALDMPREVVNEVERIQKEIIKKKVFHGKIIEGENLHLTLKFLGEINTDIIKKVEDKLETIDSGKFSAKLGVLGVFSKNYIKIVWIKIIGKEIYELQKKIDDSLESFFRKEERFMSHLTIARPQQTKNKQLFLDELKKISVKQIEFEIDRFYLIKSELKPDGPVYTIIREFKLK